MIPVQIRVAFFLALRQIKRANKATTMLIVFIMTLTFLNLVVVNGILVGLIRGSYEQFRERYSGDILISPQDRLESITGSQNIITFAKSLNGVEAVAPRLVATGAIRADLSRNPSGKESPNESRGSIVGIDPESEELVTGFSDMVLEGQALTRNDAEGILIGANLIKEYSSFGDANFPGFTILRGIKVGDRVRLSLSVAAGNGTFTTVSKEFTVRGIIKSKVDQVSQRSFLLNSELRKLIGNTDLNLQEIAVNVKSDHLMEGYYALSGFSDPSKVRVQLSADAVPSFLRTIEQTFGVLGNAIGGIGLVVTSITTFIVIFINAVTRRKFIGILKGIGIDAFAIELAYVFQALFYGVIGSILGIVITFGFLVPLFAAKPLDFPFSDGILSATVSGALIRAGILLIITLIAGYLPARMIVKKNTLDSILGR